MLGGPEEAREAVQRNLQAVLPWDQLAKGLLNRSQAWTEEQHAAERQRLYEAWAKDAVERCFDDLEHECRERVSHCPPAVSQCVELDIVDPGTRAGVAKALRLRLGQDEVHIHASFHPGVAPTLHMLWSRKRQGRYCQMVPVTGSKLMPRDQLSGYRMCPIAGSGDEILPEHLVYRALTLLTNGLLTNGAR